MLQTLLYMYLWGLSVLLIFIMVRQYWKGQADLFSTRNFFLAGFIIFQTSSGAFSLMLNEYGRFPVQFPAQSGLVFSGLATGFLILFFIAYRWGLGVRWLAGKLAANQPVVADASLMALGLVLAALALPLEFAVPIRLIGLITTLMAVGLASIAMGVVGWVWAKRVFNPFVVFTGLGIFAIAMIVSLTGTFGRRGLLSVTVAAAWGAYYGYGRYMQPSKMLVRVWPLLMIVVVLVALLTAARTGDYRKHSLSAGQVLSDMFNADLEAGLLGIIGGQNTAAGAFWTIENYPERFDTRPLFTIRYMFMHYVPRAWWPNKPYPLSYKLPSMINMQGVTHEGFTTPPGVIGNAVAEGGLYALIVYALLLGFFTRFFDQLVASNPTSPIVVLPVGCALGQFIGLARGEVSLFANIIIITFVTTFILMRAVGKFMKTDATNTYPTTLAQTPH